MGTDITALSRTHGVVCCAALCTTSIDARFLQGALLIQG